jgi:hypothetical protein
MQGKWNGPCPRAARGLTPEHGWRTISHVHDDAARPNWSHRKMSAPSTGNPPCRKTPRQAPNAGFYVAPDGNDAWSGTLPAATTDRTDGPFRTLARARDELRRLRSSGNAGPTGGTVTLREGTYPFTTTLTLDDRDSGLPDAPRLYQAWPGERVVLSGGVALPPDAFRPVENEDIRARLAPVARNFVLQAHLAALGIADLGPFPARFTGAPPLPELFFNDRRMTLARWPNEGWATISAFVSPGSWIDPPTCDTSNEGGVFEYDGDRPARWNLRAGVWLHGYWAFDWHDEVVQVRAIDPAARRITLAAPTQYGVKPRNPSPRRWRAINLLEELDQPGEYCIDHAGGLLYFWPPAAPAGARILLSALNTPILAVKDAAHVLLRGFTFEASLAHAVDIAGGHDVRIQACEIRNTRQFAIRVEGGVGHKIESCDIHHTGAGGIRISGGDRRSLTPARHEVLNTHIRRFSENRATAAYALWLHGVGLRAAHNLIHDAPHQAVFIGGNDHIFEYNVVHDVCLETDDCGALYKGRNPSCRGNIIRFNFWHDIGSPRGHGSGAIYFDDGDGGDLVFGNLFLRCCQPGKAAWGAVYSHGGHDILAENNLFIDCKRAVGSGPWSDERWQLALGGGKNCGWPEKLLREVDITRPPYTTRYPELVGFLNHEPGRPRVNRARWNLLVRCAEVSSGNWQVPADQNWATDSDPGFVDAAGGDFRLRPDAPAFTRLPGLRPIPIEQMGLIQDELRPILARRGAETNP